MTLQSTSCCRIMNIIHDLSSTVVRQYGLLLNIEGDVNPSHYPPVLPFPVEAALRLQDIPQKHYAKKIQQISKSVLLSRSASEVVTQAKNKKNITQTSSNKLFIHFCMRSRGAITYKRTPRKTQLKKDCLNTEQKRTEKTTPPTPD